MEVKPTRRIRLVPHQDSGRVRWCVGHERKWQTWLKWMVFIPAILLPLVVVLIFVVKSNTSFQDGVSPSNVSEQTNLSLTDHMGQRQKRDERFSSLFKRCYKLYLKLHPDRESFLDSENNRGRKLNYLDENPSNFQRNFPVYFGENQDKHRTLEICLKNLGDQFQRRRKRNVGDGNEVRFWTQKFDMNDVRMGQAKAMKTFMNLNVDPCENFYEYACGNWEKHFEVPPDKAVFDTFEMVRDNLNLKLKELLESDSNFDESVNVSSQHKPSLKDFIEDDYKPAMDNSDAVSKARKFYKSCLKQDIIEKRGEKPLQKLLEELGGWPILNVNWKPDNFNLVWIISKLRLLNNDILISQWIGPDIQNSKKHIIHIDQTSLGLPNRAYFLDASNQKSVKAYKTFILTVAMLLGAQSNVARKDVDDVVKFETKLASILSPEEGRKNIRGIYERMTIKTFMERYHTFEWVDYFRTILGKDIDLNSTVACYCARYIDQLLILLNNTNPRTIQNYLLWRFIRHRTSNLDSRFLDSEQKSLLGRENQPPRWKFCVSQTNINMGMAVGALFVRNYFDETSRKDTIKLTAAITQAFIDTLKSKDWLSEDTKKLAVIKIQNMNLKVGFPDFLLNSTELNLKYSNVRIDENYFFENVLSVLRHVSKEDQEKVGLLVDKLAWNTAPAVVNAYYSRNKNQIMLPAGILQPPIYHKYFPKSLNFGGIGVVIGHEITHAFDDKGRLFNHDGNLELWWNSEAIEKFYYKSQCIIDQYGKYTLSGSLTPLNGTLTKGENIADNGGLKQAYKAYEKWLTNNPGVDDTLPGLNLTGPQLFFLNFAQVWCGKYRAEAVKNRLKTSVHSPGRFRVIGTLSNSPEFSNTYNCPKGSTMNPPQKCDLW